MSEHARPEFARHMRQVATILLGEPNPDCSKPDELRFGKRGSLSVDLESGVWHDHEANQGGGVLDLIERETGKSGRAAVEWLERHGITVAANDNLPAPRKRFNVVSAYDYYDADGVLLFQVCRLDPKDFRQRRPDGKGGWSWSVKGVQQVPYRLPQMLARPDEIIFVVEGEKDAENLAALGLLATCNAGGANKWHASLSQHFRGRDVVIVPDNDDAGRAHASLVAGKLRDVAASVRVLELPNLPHKGDVSDWLAAGGDAHELMALANDAPSVGTAPVPANDNAPAALPLDAGVNPYGFPHMSDKGQPLNSRENLQYVLDSYGITTCYNEITKRSEVRIPGFVAAADTYDNSAIAEILSICARNRMPQSNVINYLGTIAGRNPHNPVRDWIMSKPWDGVNRFAELAATIETADGYPVAMRDALLRRWLISAVAAVFKPHGFEAHGALVFTGPQGAGKTRWFKRLAPTDSKLVLAGAMLDPSNKDTILTAVGHWIVELGELDATFRKADVARLKSFITQSVDKVRKPYALTDSEFQRRTVFCASVNEGSYLVDDTGNRRWWTVAVERIDYQHSIDLQQLWAEVLTWFQAGEQWHLTDDENARLRAVNEGHEQRDAIADKIFAICGDPAASQRGEALMLAGDVCVALGFNPDRKNKLAAAAALRKLVPVKRDRNKTDWFLVPGGIHHRLHDNSSRAELPDENAPF